MQVLVTERGPDPSYVMSNHRRVWGSFGSAGSFDLLVDFKSQCSNVMAAQCAAMEDGVSWQSSLFSPQCSVEVAEANCGTVFSIELKSTSSTVDECQRKLYI